MNITCDYIYLKYDWIKDQYLERRPSDQTKIFNPGDFQKLIEKSRETVDLIFSKGIDWNIFLQSFNQIGEKFAEYDLTISAIEKKSDGVFVVKVSVPENSDKSEIEASFWKQYQPLLDAKDAHIKSLESNNKLLQQEIESKRKENTDLGNIIKILAAKDNNIYNFQNPQISGGFAARDYQGNVNNHTIHTNPNDEGQLSDQEIYTLTIEIKQEKANLESRYLSTIPLPENKNYLDKAQQKANNYFKRNYLGGTTNVKP